MDIFKALTDIMYNKTGKLLDKPEDKREFNPFIINRWLGMATDLNVRIINKSINLVHKGLSDKEKWYKLFIVTIPKQYVKSIEYLKKGVDKNSINSIKYDIDLLAEKYQISRREVFEYLELLTKTKGDDDGKG